MPNRAQQNSPFMKLPTELRLRIYKFALDDVVDDIESDVANQKEAHQEADVFTEWSLFSRADYPTFVGVLGFLHTNRSLRRESVDVLLAPMEAYQNTCSYQANVATKKLSENPRFNSDKNPKSIGMNSVSNHDGWNTMQPSIGLAGRVSYTTSLPT
jgi:hypothetical protein